MTDRACGSCAACCYIPAVEQLKKPCYSLCAHSTRKGCTIYQERPRECADYSCSWLESELGEESDRPDAIGIVFDRPTLVQEHADYRDIPFICAREVWPAARNGSRAAELIARFARTWVVRLTIHGGRTQLVGPAHLIELLVHRAAERAGP